MVTESKTFGTAAKRWEGVGPYYAMFPTHFSDAVVKEYTSPGELVFDPFAGRGTAVFSSASLDRIGIGIEINPVGWVYAKVKLAPAPFSSVKNRLEKIINLADGFSEEALNLPFFFQKCFSKYVLNFLVASRAELDWRKDSCDRTLMAFLLIYLHGKRGQAFSNQMRQTKAMSPQYSIKWWEERQLDPPEIHILDFMTKRLEWRYSKGTLEESGSEVFWDDAVERVVSLPEWFLKYGLPKATLLLTSPPYYGVTNYHYDQWLRLWLLGYEATASVKRGPYQGRFDDADEYKNMLENVFRNSTAILSKDSVIYVRTSNESFTKETTREVLKRIFPNKNFTEHAQPFKKPTQTHLFGDKAPKPGEVDMILTPN